MWGRYYCEVRPRRIIRRETVKDKISINLIKTEISRTSTKSALKADRKFFRGQNYGR